MCRGHIAAIHQLVNAVVHPNQLSLFGAGQASGITACVFFVFAMYAPENRAQLARNAARHAKNTGVPPGGG